jgi:hypothetical protein
LLLAALAQSGCYTLPGVDPGKPLVPSKPQTRTGPFALYSNRPISPDSPIPRALKALESDLATTLGLEAAAVDPPIEVYILEDRDAFSHFLTFYYPELPPRRAFFLARGAHRVVYTFENDRLEEDLRHEATHALLHAALGDLPLWLDEGLAEYFECPSPNHGLNAEHLARLPDDIKSGWRPDLPRLEGLKTVREMTPRDYREAWAWVHYLLDGSPGGKRAFLGYLAKDRGESPADSLSTDIARDDSDPAPSLLTHIEQLRLAPVSSGPRTAAPTILLQNAAIEHPLRSRGLWQRLTSFLGWAAD